MSKYLWWQRIVQFFSPKARCRALRTSKSGGRRHFEPLERRDLLAFVTFDESLFPTDEFSVSGSYSYSQASRFGQFSVAIHGVNTPPTPVDDQEQAYDIQPKTILAAQLLANDSDPDSGDTIQLDSVVSTSARGATVSLRFDGNVFYNPRTSPELYQLRIGETGVDHFTYTVRDSHGATATATVTVTVLGANDPPGIGFIEPQFTRANTPLTIRLPIRDGDDPLSDLRISVLGFDATMVADVILNDASTDPSITVTPVADVTGRTPISISLQDPHGGNAFETLLLVIGTSTDLDLDGISDAEEDRAPNQGDMNGDGVPDRRQIHSGSLESPQLGAFINASFGSGVYITQMSVSPAPAPDGQAQAAQIPLGVLNIELTCGQGQVISADFRSNLQDLPINAFFQLRAQNGASEWRRYMFNQSEGAHAHADRISALIADGGIGDLDGAVNGKIQLVVALASVTNPWQNLVREDVNNDGVISPIDALLVINAINAGMNSTLPSRLNASQQVPEFLDPSGDGVLSAIDALIVINWLNT